MSRHCLNTKHKASQATEEMKRNGVLNLQSPHRLPWFLIVIARRKRRALGSVTIGKWESFEMTDRKHSPLQEEDSANSEWCHLASAMHPQPLSDQSDKEGFSWTAFVCMSVYLGDIWSHLVPLNFEWLMEKVSAGLPLCVCLVYLDDILVPTCSFDGHIRGQYLSICRKTTWSSHLRNVHGSEDSWSSLGTLSVRVMSSLIQRSFSDNLANTHHQRWGDFYRPVLVLLAIFKLCLSPPPVYQTSAGIQLESRCRAGSCQSEVSFFRSSHSWLMAISSWTLLQVPMALELCCSNPEFEEKVVANYSHSLSRPGRQYCVTRRELLARKMSVQCCHLYLYCRHFTIRANHAAFRWLLSFHSL